MTKVKWKVPFVGTPGAYQAPTEAGNMLGWANDWCGYGGKKTGVEWREPYEFTATLILEDFHRGRSAVEITLLDSVTAKSYIIRGKEFLNAMKTGVCNRGTIRGRWGFKKQGASYSLTYLGGAGDTTGTD